jgi:protein-S-isoprenylcysteine O-methyltransferase Ste14
VKMSMNPFDEIAVEEAVLESHFGENYQNYKARSWRLFPWIY